MPCRTDLGRPDPALLVIALLLLTALVLLIACGGQSLTEATADATESDDVAEATEADAAANTKPAFDYPGGWLGDDACVDICGVTSESPVKRPPAVVCFNPDDEECAAKTGDGDYDYLLLAQHWLPTFCLGLEAGYDSTVTHQAGTRCLDPLPSRLTVHGLWPNYTAGFPQCCGSAEPLDPVQARKWPEVFQQRLQAQQPDPTTAGFEPALCEIYNHEWQKHGTCFAAGSSTAGDTTANAQAYFEAGLDLADQIADATAQLDAFAGTTQTLETIEALYPKDVQILCDSRRPERLLEIHTCWSREMEMLDCPHTDGFGSLTACGEDIELPSHYAAQEGTGSNAD